MGRVFLEAHGMEHTAWSPDTFLLLSPLLRDSGTLFPRESATEFWAASTKRQSQSMGTETGCHLHSRGRVEWVTQGPRVEGDTEKTLRLETPQCTP